MKEQSPVRKAHFATASIAKSILDARAGSRLVNDPRYDVESGLFIVDSSTNLNDIIRLQGGTMLYACTDGQLGELLLAESTEAGSRLRLRLSLLLDDVNRRMQVLTGQEALEYTEGEYQIVAIDQTYQEDDIYAENPDTRVYAGEDATGPAEEIFGLAKLSAKETIDFLASA